MSRMVLGSGSTSDSPWRYLSHRGAMLSMARLVQGTAAQDLLPEQWWCLSERSLQSKFHRVPDSTATVYTLTTRWHLVFGNNVPF